MAASLLGGALPAVAAAVEVTCTACYLVDDTGRVLFDRNANVPLPNASTTKMTTALVALEHLSIDDRVTVSSEAAATGGGGLDLEPEARYRVGVLLHALLMTSSNDAAVALAEASSGSEEAFVTEMERYAAALGATDTSYVTSHGLDAPGHASSAADLAVIAAALLEVPVLAAIVAKAAAAVSGPGGTLVLENRNLLLESYRGATGVKTGFTAGAGNVLVASAERNGRRVIAVAMHSIDATADAAALLDYGWDRLARTALVRRGARIGAVVLDRGSTEVAAARTVRGPHDPLAVDYVFEPAPEISSPIRPGDVVGSITIQVAGRTVSTVEAVATSPVRDSGDSALVGLMTSVLAIFGPVVGVRR